MLVLLMCLLIFTFGFVLVCIKGKISYIGAALMTTSMSFPVLFYVPIGVDLIKYFKEMDIVSQFNNIFSLINAYRYINILKYHASSSLYNIFQWLISKTGYYSLLPFLVMLIVCLSLLIPLINLKNTGKISLLFSLIIYLFLLVLFPYIYVASVVRFYLAAGLFFIITYFYFKYYKDFSKRLFFLLLYIPLIFIHESMVVPVIIMSICLIIKKFHWSYLILFILLFLITFKIILNFKSFSNNGLINITNNYVNAFVVDQTFISQIGTFFVPFLYSFSDLLIIMFNKKRVALNPELNAYALFNTIDIFLLPYFAIAQRYSVFVGLIDILLFLKLKMKGYYISDIIKIMYILTFIVGVYLSIKVSYGMPFDFSHIIQY